jgi:hypothetical protein
MVPPGTIVSSEKTGRDGQVSSQVGERAIPAQQHRELVQPEACLERRHDRPIGGPR